ncbi:MAG: hypothetical protein ACI9WU_003635 [Myxococcota bacterium]
MTGRVIKVTRETQSAPAIEPTISLRVLQRLRQHLASVGVEPQRVFEPRGVTRAMLDDPDCRVAARLLSTRLWGSMRPLASRPTPSMS